MTVRLYPGPAAKPADRLAARRIHDAVKNELMRVRAAALAWRNGVAGLLAGLIGFSLIKGRSDIGGLGSPYDVIVGVLLFAALLTGTIGALLLLRAAHGRPIASSLHDDGTSVRNGSVLGSDHAETLRAARSLVVGLALGLTCTALLTSAVATTWYGPAKDQPRIEVLTQGGAICGEVVRLQSGKLTLKTNSGEIDTDMATAIGIKSVDSCSPMAP